MANEFLDFYRSTFMGQRDQVNAERKAAKAEAKAAQASAEADKAQKDVQNSIDLVGAKEKIESFIKNLRDAITTTTDKAAGAIDDAMNTVEYTYKKGDTFGQVIKDLGLNTDAGLWGADGDVAYYSRQLADQGVFDKNGNVPVGTKIKLRRRNAPSNLNGTVQEAEPIEANEVIYDAILPRQTLTPKKPKLS